LYAQILSVFIANRPLVWEVQKKWAIYDVPCTAYHFILEKAGMRINFIRNATTFKMQKINAFINRPARLTFDIFVELTK
jgi:hypothetical protein